MRILAIWTTVLLCLSLSAAQVVPLSRGLEIGKVTVTTLLPQQSAVQLETTTDNAVITTEVIEIAKVTPDVQKLNDNSSKVIPTHLAEVVKVPLTKDPVLVRKMRAIVQTSNGQRVNAVSGILNQGISNPGISNPGIPNPGISNIGIPNLGIPNAGIPNSGIPNPGLPNPGIPNPGIPNPGIPNPGIPNPGIPNAGILNPGIPNPGIPNPGIPNPGIPNPGIPNPGIPNPGIPNPGIPNPGIPNPGIPNLGIPNPGIPNLGIPNSSIPNPGIPNQRRSLRRTRSILHSGEPNRGLFNKGIPNLGLPNRGLPNSGIPNVGIPNKGIQNVGLLNTGISDRSVQNRISPALIVGLRRRTRSVLEVKAEEKRSKALPKLTTSISTTESLEDVNANLLKQKTTIKLNYDSNSDRVEEDCDLLCTKLDLNPICATNGICTHEFPNQCVMDTFNCKHRDLSFMAISTEICQQVGHKIRRCAEQDLKV